jgi:hypothetical protein
MKDLEMEVKNQNKIKREKSKEITLMKLKETQLGKEIEKCKKMEGGETESEEVRL